MTQERARSNKRKRKPAITVEFEAGEREFVERQAAEDGGRSMGSYIRQLIRREMARQTDSERAS